jgi:PleD family two-component response regulator
VADLAIELAIGHVVRLTASIGVTSATPSPGVETLVRQTDTTLCAACRRGAIKTGVRADVS